eukprot:GHVL01003658.1.p1 GENE.GHVL01003658.1~~GHVL01003658.1.p1  ORF type:complete len:378 (-),score=82.75 GHVL01003658.1:1119-2252(-)
MGLKLASLYNTSDSKKTNVCKIDATHFSKKLDLRTEVHTYGKLAIAAEAKGKTGEAIDLYNKALLCFASSILTDAEKQEYRSLSCSMHNRIAALSEKINMNTGSLNKNIFEKDADHVRKHAEDQIVKLSSFNWNELIGLEKPIQSLKEAVILPMINPALYHGLRVPTKGILLFGPPGNGKTFLAKVAASQCNCTFFSTSASSLTSKWVGESEKQLQEIFKQARENQPSIIFVDEIDSLLSSRSEGDSQCTRAFKAEFLVQFDGMSSKAEDRLLVLAATNRPMDLDDAVLRRFTKRIFVPPPNNTARSALIQKLIAGEKTTVTQSQIYRLGELTNGFSSSDITNMCREASCIPLRDTQKSVSLESFKRLSSKDIRPLL